MHGSMISTVQVLLAEDVLRGMDDPLRHVIFNHVGHLSQTQIFCVVIALRWLNLNRIR